MPDTEDSDRYRISPITAEFANSEVELDFRVARHAQVVRDTRVTLAVMIAVSASLGVSDYLVLGSSQAFFNLLSGRIGLILFSLLVMLSAERLWRSLMDGVTPSAVEIIGITLFLSMTLLRPYEPGWHSMALLIIVFGIYVFVPNRFMFALVLSLITTVVFLILLDGHFQLAAREFFLLCILLTAVNIVGARASYRLSWRMRDEYRSSMHRSQLEEALRQERELRIELQAERDVLAKSDVLTGTINIRHFQNMLDLTLSSRPDNPGRNAPIALLVLEVDYFKQVIDTYGKQHGEAILGHLVRQCQHALRQDDDTLARLGEASFAVMLTDCGGAEARDTAERIRASLQRTPLRLPETVVYISASIGIAQWQPGETAESLMRRADVALLRARASGGNQVVQASAVLEVGQGVAQNTDSLAAATIDSFSEPA